MTLTSEQRRQQSGRDMEFNRQQSGRNMEESRRASGRKMRDDLRALSAPENQPKTLPIIEPVGTIAAQRGVAEFKVAQSGGGGGVSGDLTEVPGSREYYGAITIIPNGAYFAYLVAPVKKLTFTDGEGQTLTASLEFPDYPIGADDD